VDVLVEAREVDAGVFKLFFARGEGDFAGVVSG
jgi:hypothetical protein